MKFIKRIGGALAIGAAMMFGLPASLAQAAFYPTLHQRAATSSRKALEQSI